MSPDDIFASQMWPWPDPLLKRDPSGRIVFLNAAFLQLYGGQFEDWQGQSVGGWPAPQATGVPHRFETTVPSQDGERVYDWVEYMLADGCALAIARDVTAFIAPPVVQHAPPAHVPPVQMETQQQVPEAPAMAPPVQNEIATPPAHEPLAAPAQTAAPENNAPDNTAPAQAAPAAQTLDVNTVLAAAPPPQAPAIHEEPQQQLDTLPIAETFTADPVEATPPAQAEEPQRDFERRALPLESDNAVLGNNWRDAVIAKAIGSNTEDDSDADTDAPDDTAAAASSGNQEGLRILLAEDNAINALLTRTLLEAEGCIVEVVEDGKLAVEAIKNAYYDMIFMDMRMPNMDGLEATRKIRALDHRSKGLPIVALTANAFDDDRNACFDSGMNDFMTKPVSAEELSEMVHTWTKNREERMAS